MTVINENKGAINSDSYSINTSDSPNNINEVKLKELLKNKAALPLECFITNGGAKTFNNYKFSLEEYNKYLKVKESLSKNKLKEHETLLKVISELLNNNLKNINFKEIFGNCSRIELIIIPPLISSQNIKDYASFTGATGFKEYIRELINANKKFISEVEKIVSDYFTNINENNRKNLSKDDFKTYKKLTLTNSTFEELYSAIQNTDILHEMKLETYLSSYCKDNKKFLMNKNQLVVNFYTFWSDCLDFHFYKLSKILSINELLEVFTGEHYKLKYSKDILRLLEEEYEKYEKLTMPLEWFIELGEHNPQVFVLDGVLSEKITKDFYSLKKLHYYLQKTDNSLIELNNQNNYFKDLTGLTFKQLLKEK